MTDTYYTFQETVKIANNIKTNVEKQYKLGENPQWAYFIARQIITPKSNVNKWYIKPAPASAGDNISRQIIKKDYLDMANRLIKYVDTNKTLPNYITINGLKMKVNDYTYMFARILAYYDKNKEWPSYANVNSKTFTKPSETTDSIYDYFVKTFGKITCIDDALQKIAGRKYGYYYDDRYSNKQSIDRIKNRQGVNCTDATQMMKHVADGTGKYKKVDCVHVKCRGGDGHVYLKITPKSGAVFYRDPAAVLDSGIITKVWCSNGTTLAINPSWWLANLNR